MTTSFEVQWTRPLPADVGNDLPLRKRYKERFSTEQEAEAFAAWLRIDRTNWHVRVHAPWGY